MEFRFGLTAQKSLATLIAKLFAYLFIFFCGWPPEAED
ncbi:hypothetical protein LCAZH_1334 [Lacticaseibacillus paracasei]|uniref:Uncharacterized protein n=1 Tax=Lacticaseibacillus paracasei subsp. paracasei Lpp225 TaxID=1256225 RepID=S2NEC2_LACPA|nr:hypothetical protein LCAZH_1334 [Lacticaseibacillus paracasei]EPC27137.1 hypothetical protein Lpp46_0951 [Lacticaseibacillus paracasei subsp. paracasei Lpp46]EPC27738.1 hypothetical protein Lpp17_0571 [Lacticaseibacillus paracasei subsp. paracasei Lpp17]EPC39277.1 hypothetical protein Lpp225_0179 [Lacticaseibacillus paracasei subsp. paracasei Lpp225]AGP68219.1 Hypothetical protein LOCK919_1522 [Lacticaseibacillus paracasei]